MQYVLLLIFFCQIKTTSLLPDVWEEQDFVLVIKIWVITLNEAEPF